MRARMNSWYTCNLGDPLLADSALERIRTRFLSAYANDGIAADAAVFVRHESEGRLHCEVRVYFTPAAAAFAETLGAVPCNPPSAAGLGLLAGPESAWPTLFPEDRS
jgi:hypothetical protein